MINMFGTFKEYLNYTLSKAFAKGYAIGLKKGLTNNISKGKREILEALRRNGMDIQTIAHHVDMTPEEVQKILNS